MGGEEHYYNVSGAGDAALAEERVSEVSGLRRPPRSELEMLRERVAELEADQLLLEDQVRQLHRVKSIMDLLQGVAHDLSNALTGIVWCSEALARRLDAIDSDLTAGLADFVGAAEYARKLARRLLAIGRQRDGRFEACRVEEVVRAAASLLETLRPRAVVLTPVLCAPNAVVWGNAEQLQQVIVNLATNAFDAVAGAGGTVQIELEEGLALSDERPGVLIRVRDTGQGMSAETLRRAFEPFFTTKGAKDGNGLGLVVVKTIVERHGGELRAKSVLGRGTTIEVLLPLFEAAKAGEAVEAC